MKKHFVSFADSQLHRSARRIQRQAEALNFFDTIITADENDLSQAFKTRFKSNLITGSRGYGYWCWKPQIILQVLDEMGDGDILQYTDAGCHLNKNGIARLHDYFRLAAASSAGILAFQAKQPEPPLVYDGRKLLDAPDSKWIKGDLADYFGVRNRPDILNTPTIGATIVFVRKCRRSVEIINQWLNVIEADFSLLDDSPSSSPNLTGFIEHRHDQAIFSILCKLNDVETLSAYEYCYPSLDSGTPDWKALEMFPIHARRDKNFGLITSAKKAARGIFRRMSKILAKFRRKCSLILP